MSEVVKITSLILVLQLKENKKIELIGNHRDNQRMINWYMKREGKKGRIIYVGESEAVSVIIRELNI